MFSGVYGKESSFVPDLSFFVILWSSYFVDELLAVVKLSSSLSFNTKKLPVYWKTWRERRTLEEWLTIYGPITDQFD